MKISFLKIHIFFLRKGAPFYDRFNLLLNRLEDAGITSYWINDVLRRRITENRAMINTSKEARQTKMSQVLYILHMLLKKRKENMHAYNILFI